MTVFILKEGKEYNQGVAYLDDGTMVVVDNARARIGKKLEIVVTSVLQTTAGRMIFGRHAEAATAAPQEGRRGRRIAATGRPRAGVGRRKRVTLPPFHWWRTVFFLIPAIAVYTIVLGIVSLDRRDCSTRSGRLPHKCAQMVGARDSVHERRESGSPDIRCPPNDQSCVFVANHSSIYDTPIVFTGLPRQLRLMAKATLGYVPFIGWHLARSGHVLVNRKNPGAGIFKRMQRMARSGASLIVFPEASRTSDGR